MSFATAASQKSVWGFSPQSIPGLKWWLDGADATSMTFSSGSNITQWRDKSGNGFHATGVNSPQKISTGGVSFVASSSNYFTMAVTYSRTQTMFMVASPVPSTSANQYYINTSIGNHGGIFLGGYNSSYISYYNSAITNFASGTTTNPFVVSVVKVQGGTAVGNYNGSQAFSVADNSVDSDTDTWAVLGGAASNAGLLTASIYEFVIFNVALTTTQIQQVEGYLAAKWGLGMNLPPTHPYSSVIPILPTQISGCQLWLDAADTSTRTLSGTLVTEWRDKSGNGFHMNQLPRDQWQGIGPAIYPSVGTAINNSNIFFSAWAGLKQATVINGAKNFYWVGRIAAGSTRYFLMGADATIDWTAEGGPNTKILDTAYAQAGLLAASPASQYTTGANAVVNTAFSNILYPSAGDVALLTVAGITGNTRYQGVCFDRQDHTGWCGDLAEVVIYSTALTTAQHQQVEGYLAWKWGLQVNLPQTHPYKLFPPPPS